MRKYLTVSEAAKLLNISAHTIRYYDKEGLIKLKHDDENEYRLFDYDDIYILSTIIVLRESGIPIKDIKALLQDYNVDEYTKLLEISRSHVNAEMKKLKNLKTAISGKLDAIKNLKDIDKKISIVTMPKRYFRQVKKSDYKMDYTLKELYDIYLDKQIDISELYKCDIFYILDDESITLCSSESKLSHADVFAFDEGEYVDYTFKVYNEDELYKRIEEIFYYFTENNLEVGSEMIMILGINGMMMDNKSYIAQLQLKIKN